MEDHDVDSSDQAGTSSPSHPYKGMAHSRHVARELCIGATYSCANCTKVGHLSLSFKDSVSALGKKQVENHLFAFVTCEKQGEMRCRIRTSQ